MAQLELKRRPGARRPSARTRMQAQMTLVRNSRALIIAGAIAALGMSACNRDEEPADATAGEAASSTANSAQDMGSDAADEAAAMAKKAGDATAEAADDVAEATREAAHETAEAARDAAN